MNLLGPRVHFPGSLGAFFPSTACLLAAHLTVGCGVDLGACDATRAKAIVYNEQGVPAYEGQALVQVSCGNGAFCHASGAVGRERLGVPAELDFDLHLASLDAREHPAAALRLARGAEQVRDSAENIYDEVESGTMPPFGDATLGPHAGLPRYHRPDGLRLPSIDSREGLDVLRNWLACDAPLIERTEGLATIGDVIALGEPILPDATYDSIYSDLLLPRCGTSCHGPANPEQISRSGLDLSDRDVAYARLVGGSASGDACGRSASVLVIPGSPENSLLIAKLRNAQACGDAMPSGTVGLPEPVVLRVEQWIAAGALR